MIIVLPESTAATDINKLTAIFGHHRDVFTHRNRISIAGISIDQLPAAIRQNALEIITDVPAAIQSSRLLHPENEVIRLPHTTIGDGSLAIMAGPCSVESEEHVRKMAAVAKQGGATVLRGGAFKPRTSPYSFQGLGEAGLKFLREAADEQGMDVITEVMDDEHVPMVAQYTDIIQIGSRNMQNFSLLKAVGKTNIPVALKRGMSATVDDWLNAAEYIAAEGNHQIMLVERGIRTFDNTHTRNTFDAGAIAALRQLTPFSIIADPSHATGDRSLVGPVGLAGIAAGADGLIVEIHDHPEQALSDGPQALTPAMFQQLAKKSLAMHNLMNNFEEVDA